MNAIPTMDNIKNSGEPNVNTSGRTTGMASAKAAAPTMAPIKELVREAPNARPACPFFAIAWPSRMVATVVASPGMPNRMEVISPVVATTECIPRRKANACTGAMR